MSPAARVSKSRMERRLQTLESVLIRDVSHAVPHSQRWLLYWADVIGKLMSGELTRETLPGLIPLDAYRAVFGREE
jgi:hypothetical protein